MSGFDGVELNYSLVQIHTNNDVTLPNMRFAFEYGGIVLLNESFETSGGLGLIYKVRSLGTDEVLALKCPKNSIYILII